jgi:hypothetical protein
METTNLIKVKAEKVNDFEFETINKWKCKKQD